MFCPSCHHTDTIVIDSRIVEEGAAIRRRRECEKCHHRFSTYERVELLGKLVIKKDGSKEPYQTTKLERGLRIALRGQKVSEEKIVSLISGIEDDIYQLGKKEISSEIIGATALKHLLPLNQVAYIRFASVYRSFSDLRSFQRELDRVQKALARRK